MSQSWLALVLFLFAFMSWAQTDVRSAPVGRITGTVLTEDGQLASGATACTSMRSGNSTSINCMTLVDAEGRFIIEHLKFGTYEVFATNDGQGYSIENQIPGTKVQVSATNPSTNVIVHLRPKGAVLNGIVRDKITGQPVKRLNLQYVDVDGKASGGSPMQTDGAFHVTLPSNCDLVIIVFAKGYKGWVYTDPSSPSRPVLHMASGESKDVDIELEPSGVR